jgi:hypothetical protein
MTNEIVSYLEMCRREGEALQRGMNFGIGGTHSVILMSLRPGAPCRDRVESNGAILNYEGHDQPRGEGVEDPKKVDQLEVTPSGTLTQNGLFLRAAREFRDRRRQPERVRVYEKRLPGGSRPGARSS